MCRGLTRDKPVFGSKGAKKRPLVQKGGGRPPRDGGKRGWLGGERVREREGVERRGGVGKDGGMGRGGPKSKFTKRR